MLTQILLSLFFVGTGIAAALIAPMSFMAFDSGSKGLAWVLVGAVLAYPALVVLTQIVSWFLFATHRGGSVLVSLVPLVCPVVFAVGLLFGPKR